MNVLSTRLVVSCFGFIFFSFKLKSYVSCQGRGPGIKGRFYSTQYGSSFSLMFKEGNVRGQPPSPGSVGSHYEWQIIHIPGNNGSENTISIWMTSSNQWVKYNARNSPLQMVSEQNTKEFNDSTTFWLRPNIWGNYPYSYALEALTEPGYFISTVAGSNLHLYQHSSSDPHVVWYILEFRDRADCQWIDGNSQGHSHTAAHTVKNTFECVDICKKEVTIDGDYGKVPNGVTIDTNTGVSCTCNYEMKSADGSGSYKSCFIPHVQFYLNGTGVSPFNLTIDNQIALHWNVSDPRKSIPVYAENVSSLMSWGEQKYNETFESATEGFTIVHTYKTPGYFTVKGDISYDGIRQLVKRNMIVCYRVEDSLLRFDNSSNIIRIGENSYIVSVKTDVLTADYDVAWKGFDEADPSPASNCSVFGFEVPIIGETILNATLSSPAGIMTYVEMATTAYGFFPVIMDITNLIIQYSVVNYTLDLIVQGSCGDLSQSVILQFEEPVKELRLKYDDSTTGFACTGGNINITWLVQSGNPVHLRYRFNLINSTTQWYSAPEPTFNNTGFLIIPLEIHNNTNGNRSILVEAFNRLSFRDFRDIGIIMYEPVMEIAMNLSALTQFVTVGYGLVFPQNENINFSVITNPASGILLYTWLFEDGHPNVTTFYANTTHTYETFGEKNITVFAETCNHLSTNISVNVHPQIENARLACNESFTGYFNDTLELNVTADKWGIGGCVYIDYGDGTPPQMNCTSHIVSTVGFTIEEELNATNGLAINFTHKFPEPGIFNVTIIMNNTVSSELLLKTFNITPGPCFTPNVTLTGGGPDNLTALEISRHGSNTTIRADIAIDCVKSQEYDVKWTFYGYENHEMKLINLNIPTDNTTITVPEFILPFGPIKVEINVSMTHRLFDHLFTVNETYLKVNVTNLTVEIMGGEEGLERHGRQLNLNSTISDIDYRNGIPYDISITWLCFHINDDIPNLDTIDLEAIQLVSPPRKSKNRTGCFGDGVGKLSGKGPSFFLNTTHLLPNGTYIFTIIVTKMTNIGNYKSHYSQTVKIEFSDTPDLSTKCVENCKEKMIASQRLVLRGDCLTSCIGTLFEWKIWIHGENAFMPGIENLITTPVNGSMFVLKPDIFKEKTNYTVVQTASRESGAQQVFDYLVVVDEVPKGGSCSVSPSEGEAVKSKFKITCQDWNDEDFPLTYQVDYSSDGNNTNTIYKNKSSACETVFGPGKEIYYFKIFIVVKIYDHIGAFARYQFTITVRPVVLTLADASIISDLSSADTGTLVAVGVAVAVSLNEGNSSSEERKTLRQNLVATTAERPPGDAVELQLLSKTVVTCMGSNPGDLNTNSVVKVGMAMEGMSNMFASNATADMNFGEKLDMTLTLGLMGSGAMESNLAVTNESNDAEVCAATLIGVAEPSTIEILNSISSANNQPLPPRAESRNHQESKIKSNQFQLLVSILSVKEKKMPSCTVNYTTRDRMESALKNVDNTAEVLASSLIEGEKDLTVNCGNMGIRVEKTSKDGPRDKDVQTVNGAGVGMPSGVGREASIKLLSTSYNPFSLHNTSSKPDSAVLGITLGTRNGTVHNLNAYATLVFEKEAYEIPDAEYFDLRPLTVENLMNYHSVDITSNQSLHFQIIPTNYCVNFSVYLKKDVKPTEADHDLNWTLPLPCSNNASFNVCNFYSTRAHDLRGLANLTDCEKLAILDKDVRNLTWGCKDPYTIFLSNMDLRMGKYWIGISYKPFGGVNIRDYNIALKKNVSNITSNFNCSLFDNGTISYRMRNILSACVYWDKKIKDWSSEGCRVGKKSTLTRVECECNHFSSFASKVFVAPNPIDISAVLAGFSNIADNLSVLMLECGLVGLYIILVIICRKFDKKDQRKHGLTIVGPNHPYGFKYLIITFTGARPNAGTSANVWIILKGKKNEGEPKLLMNPNHILHLRGDVNAFQVSFQKPLGEIHSIEIGHDNSECFQADFLPRAEQSVIVLTSEKCHTVNMNCRHHTYSVKVEKQSEPAGENPSWYLSQVYIFDLNRDISYQFCSDKWLAVEEDDGLIERRMQVATAEEKKAFVRLFTTKIGRGFTEKHLWISVLTKPIYSQFSRVQRLTCCFCLLFFTMLTSAMFFSFGDGPNPYVLKIGSLEFNYRGVIVGVQSSMISIIPTTIVLYIFQNARDRPSKKKKFSGEDLSSSSGVLFKPPKKPKGLHHRWRILAWFLAFGMFSSAFIVCLFYSMMWGDAKSKQWVAAITTGLFNSVIIVQPANIIIVSVLIAIILNDNAKEDNLILEEYTMVELDVQYADDIKEKSRKLPLAEDARKPLPKEDLERARRKRLLEIKTKAYLKEMITYFIFVAVLSLVVSKYRTPDEYRISRALEYVTMGEYFSQIQDTTALWNWLHDVMIPRLFQDKEVPSKRPKAFLPINPVTLLGQSRIRQVRMKGGSCEIPDIVKNISKDCIDFYSLIGEEDRVWTTEWKNFTNTKSGKRKKRYTDDEPCCFENYETEIKKRERRALRLKLRSSKYFLDQAKAKVTVDSDSESLLLDIQSLYPSGIVTTDPKWWKFFGALDLDGFPFWGHFSVYGGGGYSAPFKDDVLSSFKVSASLANYHWIDRYSRGVFIEFSVYSPDTNIFATSFMLFEVHPTGALRTQSGVKTFSIYRYHGKSKNATMSGEIIVILFLFYFIYREIRQMINEKCKYFKSVFNWVDVLIIIFTFCGVILWLGRWYQEDKVLLAYKNNQDKYHSFPYAAAANELFIYVVALIVYLCTMRMMRVLNVFPVVVLFLGVLKSSRMKLLAFLLPFLVMFLAFVQLSYSFFNTNEHFSSFVRTIITLFLATLGGPYYYEMKAANSILGPIFYFSFSLFTVMVMLNLLISIINDAIADETGNFASSQKDLEFVEYLFTKINSVIRIEMVDVSSLAELREQQERKMAKIEKMREKRQKEIEEKLKRLQEGQEAYLLLGKRIKDAKNTLDTICANLDKYISMIEGDNKKMMTIITSNEVIPFNSKSESSKKY